MITSNIDNLLKHLYIVYKEYKMLADREEKFNVFSALHKEHDERRLHSRFISVLLQPNGTHGMGNLFLSLFLKGLNYSGIIMDTNNTVIESEESDDFEEVNKATLVNFKLSSNTIVYPTEKDKKENNNIDIQIIDRINKQCIIIENKIYAGDSNGAGGEQLKRYIDHVVFKEKIPIDKISVVYLTLDGHDPSKESVGDYYGKKDIILADYQHFIIDWLEKCLSYTSRAPFLRESLVQYIKLIKKMTVDNTSIEERQAYRELIGKSEENMNATKKLFQNFKHVKWHAVYDFWDALRSKITDCNYLITKDFQENRRSKDVVAELTHFEEYRKGQKEKQRCILNFTIPEGIEFTIRFTDYDKFHFGIDKVNNTQREIIITLIKNKNKYLKGSKMLLYKRFNKNIYFNNFNQSLAFDLIDKKRNKAYVEEAWLEVETLINEYKEVLSTLHSQPL